MNKGRLESMIARGIKVYNSIPQGWTKIDGATTQPQGYQWINNGLSRWDKNYMSALCKEVN